MLNKAGCSLTCWAPSSAEPHQVQQKKLSQHCRSHGPGYPLPLLTPLRSTDWFRVSQQACVVWALRLRQFNWYSVITQRWPILPRALALAISLSLSLPRPLLSLSPLSLSLSVSLPLYLSLWGILSNNAAECYVGKHDWNLLPCVLGNDD